MSIKKITEEFISICDCACDYILCSLKFEHFYEKEKFNDLIIEIHEVMMVYTLLKVPK